MIGLPLVCEALGISTSKAYDLLADGTFPIAVVRIGGTWKVRTVDARRYFGLDGVCPTCAGDGVGGQDR